MDSSDPDSTELQPLDDETKRQIDLAVEIQIRIIAGAYEKANAYTNLIILAGYAGLFALWQFTKENLSRTQVIVSALLTLTSITIFVLFEIYKAHFTSRQLRQYADIVQQPQNRTSPERLLSAMNSFEAAERAADSFRQILAGGILADNCHRSWRGTGAWLRFRASAGQKITNSNGVSIRNIRRVTF